MPSRNVMDRLNAGEFLLMDGGTGSELQRRGADVLVGATADSGLVVWSATANVEYGDVVRQFHRDYLRVGADIIISNNFTTGRSQLSKAGLGDRWEEYARAAAGHAAAARDAMNPEAYVAAGISSPFTADSDGTKSGVINMGAAYGEDYADHARLAAGMGVDVMLPEYIGWIDDCVAAVDACAEAGLPVWLGVRHITEDGLMQYGESLEDLVTALEGHPVDAILLMCSTPQAITEGMKVLQSSWEGPTGAYPNIGYNPTGPLSNRPTLTNRRPSDSPDIIQVQEFTPSKMEEFAAEWKDMGVQIIGGCCASGPEHIMTMCQVVKGS